MELLTHAVQIIQVVVSILLILVVLLQPGKSGDLGSIFGGGTSESVFGAAGAVPFLEKLTRGLAVLFMVSSLALGFFAAKGGTKSVITDVAPTAVEQTIPDTTATTGDEALVPADESTDATATEPAENAAATDGEPEATAPEAQDTAESPPAEGGDETAPEAQETTQ